MLLMDSGGSMDYYSRLCSALFQAANKSERIQRFAGILFPQLYLFQNLYRPFFASHLPQYPQNGY